MRLNLPDNVNQPNKKFIVRETFSVIRENIPINKFFYLTAWCYPQISVKSRIYSGGEHFKPKRSFALDTLFQ